LFEHWCVFHVTVVSVYFLPPAHRTQKFAGWFTTPSSGRRRWLCRWLLTCKKKLQHSVFSQRSSLKQRRVRPPSFANVCTAVRFDVPPVRFFQVATWHLSHKSFSVWYLTPNSNIVIASIINLCKSRDLSRDLTSYVSGE